MLFAQKKIKIRAIVSFMGWPSEDLVKALDKVPEVLKNSAGWKIIKKEVSPPEKVGEKMFSSYVEFEAEVKGPRDLFLFVLTYAPFSIEILEPSELVMPCGELQDFLTDISAKMQEMDINVKTLSSQNANMARILEDIKAGKKVEFELKSNKEVRK